MNTSALAPGLARKVKKILEIKTESQDLIAALSTLSATYQDNTPAARRHLRSTIEQRGLGINEQFLEAAEGVTQALDEVQAQLDVLSGSCGAISGALATARVTASGLLTDADKAVRQLSALDAKQSLVEEFLVKYQLTPEEVAALQGGRVGPEFFAALTRVRAIHEHCKGLLRSTHQRAGLELMDQMAAHQEAAYEHLCRWVQAECRNLGEYDAPEVEPTLTAAVAALRDRPVLFKYCAEEVAAARNGALFQRFIVALTRGGPGGLPRPIEIHAHDPRRYVADMLAWVHQALCGEREFVVSLFEEQQQQGGSSSDTSQLDQQRQQLPPVHTSSSSGAGAGAVSGGGDTLSAAVLLDRIFESICRPLKVRVEQVLMMSPPLLLCYQLGQLTAFYHGLLVDILGPGAALSQAVAGCRDVANRTFMEQLKASGDRLLRQPPPPPSDLSPPLQVTQTLQVLSDIITAYEGSMQRGSSSTQQQQQQPDGSSSTSDAAADDVSNGGAGVLQQDQQDQGLSGVLSAVLEPLTEMIRRSAEALSPDSPARLDDGGRLDPTAYRVYMVNCLAACHTTLVTRTVTAAWTQHLADNINSHLESLITQEVLRLLNRSGLAEVVERVRLYKASAGIAQAAPLAPLAADPALSLSALSEALRQFFVTVSSPDALPEFTSIQAPRLRGDAVSRVAGSLVSAYEAVYDLLDDPTAGYAEQGGSGAVKHTPAQVRTILGVL